MKKILKAAKIIAVSLMFSGLSACSTTNQHSVEDWQGKVWRAVVVKQLVDTTSFTGVDPEWARETKFDLARDTGLRMTRVHLAAGWNSVMASAVVPDNIEFSQIPKGTLVDVMTETGPNMDHAAQRFTRVLRIVCAADDKACIDAEDKANHIRKVVDEKPSSDISSRYGVTYNRRETKEDVKAFD